MKIKKISYLLVFILMLSIGVNGVDAAYKQKYCYYLFPDGDVSTFKATLRLRWGGKPDPEGWDDLEDFAEVMVQSIDDKVENNSEPLLNWIKDFLEAEDEVDASGSPELGYYYTSEPAVENMTTEPSCPTYLIFTWNQNWAIIPDSYNVFATESLQKVKESIKAANKTSDIKGYYATYKDAKGKAYSAEEYYATFASLEHIDWTQMTLQCKDFLGDENDPESIRSLLNTAMLYVRIIVPILIILLGSVDLAKAVIAGKEDNMKKAQMDFAKRILIGVAVFFVPTLVDIIMDLAKHVWQGMDYETCRFIGL